MERILKAKEKLLLNNKYYIIKIGKVITKDILSSGKIISNEECLREGEIIGNFLNFFTISNFYIPEVEVEIEALEETILEEFLFEKNIFSKENLIIEKLIQHLIRKAIIKSLYQIYSKEAYILAILKLYANNNGILSKKEISYENFNISKSQFYLIFSKLKSENYLYEIEKNIYLNLDKINKKLSAEAENG